MGYSKDEASWKYHTELHDSETEWIPGGNRFKPSGNPKQNEANEKQNEANLSHSQTDSSSDTP